MRRVASLALLALSACFDLGSTPPAPPPPEPPAATTPSPLEGWVVAGAAASEYTAAADATVAREGRATVVFRPIGDTGSRYATFMTGLDCAPFRAHRVRASVWVRTIGVTGRGDFWLRAQAPDSPADGAGMASTRQRLRPDGEFGRYDLVLDVPQECDRLQLGVGLGGPGMLWMDGVRVDLIDGASASAMQSPSGPANATNPASPANPANPANAPVDGWWLRGDGRDEYSFGRDTVVAHEGRPSVAMAPRGLPSGVYGGLVRDWDATPWRGRRVRVSAWVRSEAVTMVGEFSVSVSSTASPAKAPPRQMASRRLAPSSDFASYQLELVVPPDALAVSLAVGVAGPGKIWVEGGRIDPADAAVPPSPPPAPTLAPTAPPQPQPQTHPSRGVDM
jgi:hypothetical protein